jgi:hypothetical protein
LTALDDAAYLEASRGAVGALRKAVRALREAAVVDGASSSTSSYSATYGITSRKYKFHASKALRDEDLLLLRWRGFDELLVGAAAAEVPGETY